MARQESFDASMQALNQRFKEALSQIKVPMTEGAMTELLIQAATYSATRTPVDTTDLINSQYREVYPTADGWYGELGYGAEYAVYVHESSGKLKGKPRADFGKTRAGFSFGGGTGVGNYWDPYGEPEFLLKGVDEMMLTDMEGILRRNYSS